jgi:hypothetical protein
MFERSHATLLILPLALLLFGASAAAQTVPLARYQNKAGITAYAAAPEHRKVYQDNASSWSEQVVGHCYAANQPGTMPLFNFKRPTKFGDEHFYTTDIGEAVALQKSSAMWMADDVKVVCRAATSKLPGTVPVYRYRQPGGTYYIYAFGESENSLLKQNPELKFERVAFYVWAQDGGGPTQHNFPDPTPQKPDLSVGNVGVFKNGKVIFAVRNHGFTISQRAFVVRMTAYDQSGGAAWTAEKSITPLITKGGTFEESLEPPAGKTLAGVKLKVTVDAGGAIEETDENNNASDFVDGLPLQTLERVITRPAPAERRPAPEVPRRAPTPPTERRESLPPSSNDLKLRQALYSNGADASKVNTASRYATPSRALTLKKSEAISCDGDKCTFNLGFFALRGDRGAELSTYALLRGATFGIVGNTVFFASGEMSRGVVHAVKLKAGENKVVVEIDPYKKTAESDEANNSFEVTIVVEP